MILSKKPSGRKVAAELLALAAVIGVGIYFEDVLTDPTMKWITAALAVVGTAACWLFVVYFTRSAWRKSLVTRSLMVVAVTFGIYLALILTSWLLPPYRGERAVSLVVYCGVVYAWVRMLYVLRREQIRASRHPLTERVSR